MEKLQIQSTTKPRWKGKGREVLPSSNITNLSTTSSIQFQEAVSPALSSSIDTVKTTTISNTKKAERVKKLEKVRQLYERRKEAGLFDPLQKSKSLPTLCEPVTQSHTSNDGQTEQIVTKETHVESVKIPTTTTTQKQQSKKRLSVDVDTPIKKHEQSMESTLPEQPAKRKMEGQKQLAMVTVIKKKKSKDEKKKRKEKKKKAEVENYNTYEFYAPPKYPQINQELQAAKFIMSDDEASPYEKSMALGRFKRLIYFNHCKIEIEPL